MAYPLVAHPVLVHWTSFTSKTHEWVSHGLDREQSHQIWEMVYPLCAGGLAAAVASHVQQCLEAHFKTVVFPSFWNQATADPASLPPEIIQQLHDKVEAAVKLLEGVADALRKAPGPGAVARAPPQPGLLGISGRFRSWLGAAFLTCSPVVAVDWLVAILQQRLDQFSQAAMGADDPHEQAVCHAFDAVTWNCESHGKIGWFPFMELGINRVHVSQLMGEHWVSAVKELGEAFRSLNLHDLLEEACQRAVGNHIRTFLKERIGTRFRLSFVNGAEGYVKSVPYQFVMLCLRHGPAGIKVSELAWQERVERVMYETLGIMRSSQMFDIVMDYPATRGAITDLRVCMAYTDLHRHFVERFRTALQDRLLIPGASTEDIIMQYVSTVKALNDMDPSGSLLDAVGSPIKEYLRSRPDTVRCIVASLIQDGGSEEGSSTFLSSELNNIVDETEHGDAFEEQNRGPDALALLSIAWKPEKMEVRLDGDDLYPGARKVKVRQIDIISMLVDIYGSKELFVEQYQCMLGERLLAKTDFNIDKEVVAMELLKRRFGDSNLQNCDIMLKDMRDSQRINRNIQGMPPTVRSPVRGRAVDADISPLTAMIVSYLFWPKSLLDKLPNQAPDKLIFPEEMEDILEKFEGRYHVLKTPRKLTWQRHLGRVELEVSLGSNSAKFDVSPAEAALLYAFESREQWSVQQLMARTGLSAQSVKVGMNFWINNGVVTESSLGGAATPVYIRNSNLGSGGGGALRSSHLDASLLSETAEASGAETDPGGMSMYDLWILNMLKTHAGGLDLDGIHSKLCLFIPDYDKSKAELHQGLQRMLAESKVLLEGTVYRMPNA